MYRIMLGEEDIPNYKRKERYSDKMLAYSILNTNKDKKR